MIDLSCEILAAPPECFPSTLVAMTIDKGKIVYRKNASYIVSR